VTGAASVRCHAAISPHGT